MPWNGGLLILKLSCKFISGGETEREILKCLLFNSKMCSRSSAALPLATISLSVPWMTNDFFLAPSFLRRWMMILMSNYSRWCVSWLQVLYHGVKLIVCQNMKFLISLPHANLRGSRNAKYVLARSIGVVSNPQHPIYHNDRLGNWKNTKQNLKLKLQIFPHKV